MLDDAFVQKREELLEYFEQSRRDNGKKATVLSIKIVELSKQGIEALIVENLHRVDDIRKRMADAWLKLHTADIPDDVLWQREAEAGQEMVEFFVVVALYHALFYDVPIQYSNISIEKLEVTPQQWLAGILDASTELGKILLEYEVDDNFSVDELIKYRSRFIAILQDVIKFLDPFETVYGLIINNSRRKGFFNTFRGRLVHLRKFCVE